MRVKRIEAIQEYIIKNKSVTMEQLCEEFGVSMTGVGKEPFYNVESLAKYVAAHI